MSGQIRLNGDFTASVVMRSENMDWQSSPSGSVWRKRLELSGPAEAGRVTSVVRYDPGSEFPPHPHPDGEEILVLDGVFSDEHGDYPAGTFLLNPEGFRHAPRSGPGCRLFVKLRQYPGDNRRHVVVDANGSPWQAPRGSVERLPLYSEDGFPETIDLLRLAPGARLEVSAQAGGAEIFILSGGLSEENGVFDAGDWLRWPAEKARVFEAVAETVVYQKRGHLPF